VRSILPLS
jgi:hypothetical protein